MKLARPRRISVVLLLLQALLFAGLWVPSAHALEPFLGTVSLATDRATTTPYAPSALLTASASAAIPSGYYLAIYDQAGTRRAYCSSTPCSFYASPTLNATETFTAYVAQNMPSTGTPTGDVHASSSSVAVNRVGYLGTVTLTADQTRLAPGASTLVNAVVSAPLVSDVSAISRPLALTDTADDSALLASAAVAVLESRLIAKFGDEATACIALGEATRTHSMRSSVPDATLVCDAKGLHRALQLLSTTNGLRKALGALEVLDHATTAPAPANPRPDCDQLDAANNCIEEGTPEPEPEPAAAGAGGLLPPADCLGAADREVVTSASPFEDHHVVPWNNQLWGPRYRAVLDNYGLAMNGRKGPDEAWNLIRNMQHKGGHPKEYHQWVLDNLRQAHQEAQGDQAIFLARFDQYVKSFVFANPGVVRASWWECYRP